jgi:hypothetical protein
VIERAVSPVDGIPAKVGYLSLAEIRKHLDVWRTEHLDHLDRLDRATRKPLPAPPVDPAAREVVLKGLAELSARLKAGSSSLRDPLPAVTGAARKAWSDE